MASTDSQLPVNPRRVRYELLSIEMLSRVVGTRTVVSEMSFELSEGEVLAILGPSGSGKTSLLRMIAGFDAPTAGLITLRGRTVSTSRRILVAPEHRGMSVAFQDATLLPHLDAVGNVAFAIRHVDRGRRRELARQALRQMGLETMDGRDVATLSGGEAQRVSLARAFAGSAELLLLDEPFGNVDRLTRADLIVRLKAQLDRGRAAIIITHDPADAVELGARVLLIQDGRLVADAAHEAIAAGACGEWARNFFGGRPV